MRLISSRPDIVDSSGLAAEEGTAAHELLEQCLLTAQVPETFRGTFFNIGCKLRPDGFEADNDMIEAVEVATTFIWSEMGEGALMYPERKINPGTLIGRDDCTGTADITIIQPPRVKIYDYKHGKGILVEVVDNLQGLLYAIGVIAELPPEQLELIEEVELGIIQPRASHPDGPVRTHVYTIAQIYQWVEYFRTAAALTDHPEAPLVAGSSQCKFCPIKRHRDSCPTMLGATTKAFQIETINQIEPKVFREVTSISLEEKLAILDMADVIEQFVKAVKGQAQEDLKNGIPVPGQKLVRGQGGHRKFNIEDDKMIKRLSSNFGLKKNEVVADPKLLGVAKILTAAKKGPKYSDSKFKKLEALVVKPEGKLTMAPESDPRPAAGSLLAVEAFKDIIVS
jgi:hypothetical protein